jgi:hypothetical protein
MSKVTRATRLLERAGLQVRLNSRDAASLLKAVVAAVTA